MDRERRQRLLHAARDLAQSGRFADWRAVQAQMIQLGHVDCEELFEDHAVQTAFDVICAASRRW